MSNCPILLVVDDDVQIRRALRLALNSRGYRVELAGSREEALDLAATQPPDMVILDLSLNGAEKDGLAVCRELRAWSEVPILVLSVQDKPQDKVQALDLGADDYLTKPFETSELLARIRSHLRRSSKLPVSQPVLEVGELRLDWTRRQVFQQGQEVRLTRLEYNILSYLASNAGRVVTYTMLLNQVWGPSGGDLQTLRVHLVNLRRKIEPDLNRPRYLLTEAGVGYRFAVN